MVINLADNTPRISYTVNQGATQTAFAVPFEFFADADLNVYVDGTKKSLSTHYTTSANAQNNSAHIEGETGYIHTTANNSVVGATGGSTVVITRDIVLSRTSDFPTAGAFDIKELNDELDRNIAIASDLNDLATRTIRLKDFDTGTLELPIATARANRFLKFDANGNLTTDLAPSDLGVSESIIFEGATADEYETTLRVQGPTGSDKTITLPNATGTVSLTSNTETLTNKTLTTPVIEQISNSGTLTLPTSTDTLVGRETTDTLRNKTIPDAIITGFDATVSETLGVSIGYDSFGHAMGVSIGMHSGRTVDSNASIGSISIGTEAMEHVNGTGEYNIAIGWQALQYIDETPDPVIYAQNNIAIGYGTLKNSDFRGSYNVAIGSGAGTTITTGDGNVMIGYDAEPSSATADGEFKITSLNGNGGDKVTYMSGTASGAVGTVTVTNNLIVGGNLTVNGTTTTVNSTTVTVDDPIFTIGGDTAPDSDDNKDRGIEFRYYDGSAKVGFFGFDESVGKFTFIPDATNSSEVFSGTAGTIVADLEGTLQTASQTNITGVGTISTGTWQGTAIADTYIASQATWHGKVDTGGTGLTKSGTTLNVDAAQSGITSLGTLTGLSVDGAVTITDASDGSDSATELKLEQTTTSPALYDYGAKITFYHENDADESIEYSSIRSRNLGFTDGSEEGRFEIWLKDGGTDTLCYGWDNNLLQIANKQTIYWYNFTSTHDGALTPATLSDTRIWTLPDATGTVITTGNLGEAKVRQTAYVNAILFG